jgi:hypothetical protein
MTVPAIDPSSVELRDYRLSNSHRKHMRRRAIVQQKTEKRLDNELLSDR